MVVAVGDEAQNLFKLIEAVGSHDARILVEIIRQPANQTQQKGTQTGVLMIKTGKAGLGAGGSLRRAGLNFPVSD